VGRAADELALVKRLEDIRLKRATLVERYMDMAGADRDYAAEFRAAGLGEVGSDAAGAAAWVRQTSVADALVAALDDWADCAVDRQRRSWVLEVVRQADPDPWRDVVRDPAAWDDADVLAQRVRQVRAAQQSPQLLAVVGGRLRGPDAVELLKAAWERHPGDYWVNFHLGYALVEVKKPELAVGYYRAALALRPGTVAVHTNLGVALRDQGKVKEAMAAYRKAIELDTKFALAHSNLGLALYEQHKVEEAIAAYRKAIELDPKDPKAHHGLGLALSKQRKVEEAIAAYRKAIEIDPRLAQAHGALGEMLLQHGNYTEARQATRRCLDLLPVDHPARAFASQQLRQCERMLAIEQKLAAVLSGGARPTDAAEQVGLAALCHIKKRYTDATRFFADAFKAQPKLAEDLQGGHRYNAACAAALAAAGKGEGATKLDDKERARLRQQALGWLRADLALWGKQVESGTPQARAAVQKTLQHWQEDADLAGVREPATLDKLPEAERGDWKKLWADVEALRKKAGKGDKP
jgi:tetratricopeptide (TPR) repeat protein